MKEVTLSDPGLAPGTATFLACLATIVELEPEQPPRPADGVDPPSDWRLMRWLGSLGLGLVPIADPAHFAWAGPWIARIRPAGAESPLAVVMYGVPSGVAWDPSGAAADDGWEIEDGFVVAPLDVALTTQPRAQAPTASGTVEAICIAPSAGAPTSSLDTVRAHAGRGLEGDRHVAASGTFPSGVSGSALTLIEAEVCESFTPPLEPDDHRRNLVTRGIELNGLVGHEFTIGAIRCLGVRLCEPCVVVELYASQPILRRLVHRGGLRADILEDGVIAVGDSVTPAPA